MILPYAARLACVCLAAFFLVHLALGLLVSTVTGAALRRARRASPATAARGLLALRLAPATAALFVVLGLCVPSYLRLEVEAGAERVGLPCLVVAVLAVALWATSLGRALEAVVRSVRQARVWADTSRDGALGLRLVEHPAVVLALAGVLRPRIYVSLRVFETLTQEQLDTALRHEAAHRASHDNLKRLFLLLAPGLVPFRHGFEALERAWARSAEWAADDSATGGETARSLALASALVRVARMEMASPLMSSFGGDEELSARVERLLRPEASPGRHRPRLAWLAASAFAALVVAVLPQPATLAAVHRWLERLIH